VNSGKYDGLDYQSAVDAIAADLKRRARDKQVTCGFATGHLAPALLGDADSDRSLVRPAATCRCPTASFRWCCRKTSFPDGTGNHVAKTRLS